jgi:hypothetical protein
VHEEDGKLRLFMPAQPFEIPVRTMTCASVRNLVVTGRAISATREANGAIRHQATAMALGQAAGHLAAHALALQGEVRAVPIKPLQESLLAVGAIASRREKGRMRMHGARQCYSATPSPRGPAPRPDCAARPWSSRS